MKNQQNTSKGIINTDLKFDGTYKNYFQWILNGFEAQEKTRYDLFSFKNTKCLAYCFNDFQNSIGEPLIKIRHSLVQIIILQLKKFKIKIGNILLNVL